MKQLKITLSIFFIVFILASLLYKNVLAPGDKSSIFAQAADMVFPLFLIFSFLILLLKKREEKKDKKKITDEDRELYKSIGKSDWDSRK